MNVRGFTRLVAIALSCFTLPTQIIFADLAQSQVWKDRKDTLLARNFSPTLPENISLPNVGLRQGPGLFRRFAQHRSTMNSMTVPSLNNKNDRMGRSLPRQYGTVRKVLNPSAEKTVLHIQDIHLNSEAQENIRLTLKGLLAENSVDVVALEGAFGPINMQPYRSFPHQQALKETADQFLTENKISGPVHALLTEKSEVNVVGVDDPKHYQANVEAYRSASLLQKSAENKLAEEVRRLREKKGAVLNASLQSLDALLRSYEEEKIQLAPYIRELKKKQNEDFASPSLEVFLEAADLETSLDTKRAEADRARLLSALANKMSPEEMADLANLTLAYRAGDIGHSQFYSQLVQQLKMHGISLASSPAFDSYVRYLLLADQINPDQIFKDLRKLETSAVNHLATNQEELRLMQEGRKLSLQKKLIQFALTTEEWREYKQLTNYDLRSTIDFENFYKEAEIRDKKMAANFLIGFSNRNSSIVNRTSILVTGGFHAEGIDTELAKKGFRVISFVPRLTKLDDSDSSYLSFFNQEKTPLEKLVQGNRLFLSPEQMMPGKQALVGSNALARERAQGPLAPDAGKILEGTGLNYLFSFRIFKFPILILKKASDKFVIAIFNLSDKLVHPAWVFSLPAIGLIQDIQLPDPMTVLAFLPLLGMARGTSKKLTAPSGKRRVNVQWNDAAMQAIEKSNPGTQRKIERILAAPFEQLVAGVDYDRRSGEIPDTEWLGRSLILDLDVPVEIDGHMMGSIKLKGATLGTKGALVNFNPIDLMRSIGRWHSHEDNEGMKLLSAFISPDGRVIFDSNDIEPLNGMTFESAKREHDSLASMRETGTFTAAPLALAELPDDVTPGGMTTGIAVLLLPSERLFGSIERNKTLRTMLDTDPFTAESLLLAEEGKYLRHLNQQGIAHIQFHGNNWDLTEDGRVFVKDTESVHLLSDMDPRQYFGYLALGLMNILNSSDKMFAAANISIQDLNPAEAILDGYFGPQRVRYATSIEDREALENMSREIPFYRSSHWLVQELRSAFPDLARQCDEYDRGIQGVLDKLNEEGLLPPVLGKIVTIYFLDAALNALQKGPKELAKFLNAFKTSASTVTFAWQKEAVDNLASRIAELLEQLKLSLFLPWIGHLLLPILAAVQNFQLPDPMTVLAFLPLLGVFSSAFRGHSTWTGDPDYSGYREMAVAFKEYWTPALLQSHRQIRSGAQQVHNKHTVTILGSNEALDVPLEWLAENFEVINLVDIDEEGMNLARNRLPPHLQEKIQIVPADATALMGPGLNALLTEIKKVVAETNISDGDKAQIKITQLVRDFQFVMSHPLPDSLTADYVISSNLSSQIIVSFIEQVRAVFGNKFSSEINTLSLEDLLARKTMDHHRITLFELLRDSGSRVYWADSARMLQGRNENRTRFPQLIEAIEKWLLQELLNLPWDDLYAQRPDLLKYMNRHLGTPAAKTKPSELLRYLAGNNEAQNRMDVLTYCVLAFEIGVVPFNLGHALFSQYVQKYSAVFGYVPGMPEPERWLTNRDFKITEESRWDWFQAPNHILLTGEGYFRVQSYILAPLNKKPATPSPAALILKTLQDEDLIPTKLQHLVTLEFLTSLLDAAKESSSKLKSKLAAFSAIALRLVNTFQKQEVENLTRRIEQVITDSRQNRKGPKTLSLLHSLFQKLFSPKSDFPHDYERETIRDRYRALYDFLSDVRVLKPMFDQDDIERMQRMYEPASLVHGQQPRPIETDIYTLSIDQQNFPIWFKDLLAVIMDRWTELFPADGRNHIIDPSTYHISLSVIQDVPAWPGEGEGVLGKREDLLTEEELRRVYEECKAAIAHAKPITLKPLGVRGWKDGGLIFTFEYSPELKELQHEIIQRGKAVTPKFHQPRPKLLINITLARALVNIVPSPWLVKKIQEFNLEFSDVYYYLTERRLPTEFPIRTINYSHETRWMHTEVEHTEEINIGSRRTLRIALADIFGSSSWETIAFWTLPALVIKFFTGLDTPAAYIAFTVIGLIFVVAHYFLVDLKEDEDPSFFASFKARAGPTAVLTAVFLLMINTFDFSLLASSLTVGILHALYNAFAIWKGKKLLSLIPVDLTHYKKYLAQFAVNLQKLGLGGIPLPTPENEHDSFAKILENKNRRECEQIAVKLIEFIAGHIKNGYLSRIDNPDLFYKRLYEQAGSLLYKENLRELEEAYNDWDLQRILDPNAQPELDALQFHEAELGTENLRFRMGMFYHREEIKLLWDSHLRKQNNPNYTSDILTEDQIALGWIVYVLDVSPMADLRNFDEIAALVVLKRQPNHLLIQAMEARIWYKHPDIMMFLLQEIETFAKQEGKNYISFQHDPSHDSLIRDHFQKPESEFKLVAQGEEYDVYERQTPDKEGKRYTASLLHPFFKDSLKEHWKINTADIFGSSLWETATFWTLPALVIRFFTGLDTPVAYIAFTIIGLIFVIAHYYLVDLETDEEPSFFHSFKARAGPTAALTAVFLVMLNYYDFSLLASSLTVGILHALYNAFAIWKDKKLLSLDPNGPLDPLVRYKRFLSRFAQNLAELNLWQIPSNQNVPDGEGAIKELLKDLDMAACRRFARNLVDSLRDHVENDSFSSIHEPEAVFKHLRLLAAKLIPEEELGDLDDSFNEWKREHLFGANAGIDQETTDEDPIGDIFSQILEDAITKNLWEVDSRMARPSDAPLIKTLMDEHRRPFKNWERPDASTINHNLRGDNLIIYLLYDQNAEHGTVIGYFVVKPDPFFLDIRELALRPAYQTKVNLHFVFNEIEDIATQLNIPVVWFNLRTPEGKSARIYFKDKDYPTEAHRAAGFITGYKVTFPSVRQEVLLELINFIDEAGWLKAAVRREIGIPSNKPLETVIAEWDADQFEQAAAHAVDVMIRIFESTDYEYLQAHGQVWMMAELAGRLGFGDAVWMTLTRVDPDTYGDIVPLSDADTVPLKDIASSTLRLADPAETEFVAQSARRNGLEIEGKGPVYLLIDQDNEMYAYFIGLEGREVFEIPVIGLSISYNPDNLYTALAMEIQKLLEEKDYSTLLLVADDMQVGKQLTDEFKETWGHSVEETDEFDDPRYVVSAREIEASVFFKLLHAMRQAEWISSIEFSLWGSELLKEWTAERLDKGKLYIRVRLGQLAQDKRINSADPVAQQVLRYAARLGLIPTESGDDDADPKMLSMAQKGYQKYLKDPAALMLANVVGSPIWETLMFWTLPAYLSDLFPAWSVLIWGTFQITFLLLHSKLVDDIPLKKAFFTSDLWKRALPTALLTATFIFLNQVMDFSFFSASLVKGDLHALYNFFAILKGWKLLSAMGSSDGPDEKVTAMAMTLKEIEKVHPLIQRHREAHNLKPLPLKEFRRQFEEKEIRVTIVNNQDGEIVAYGILLYDLSTLEITEIGIRPESGLEKPLAALLGRTVLRAQQENFPQLHAALTQEQAKAATPIMASHKFRETTLGSNGGEVKVHSYESADIQRRILVNVFQHLVSNEWFKAEDLAEFGLTPSNYKDGISTEKWTQAINAWDDEDVFLKTIYLIEKIDEKAASMELLDKMPSAKRKTLLVYVRKLGGSRVIEKALTYEPIVWRDYTRVPDPSKKDATQVVDPVQIDLPEIHRMMGNYRRALNMSGLSPEQRVAWPSLEDLQNKVQNNKIHIKVLKQYGTPLGYFIYSMSENVLTLEEMVFRYDIENFDAFLPYMAEGLEDTADLVDMAVIEIAEPKVYFIGARYQFMRLKNILINDGYAEIGDRQFASVLIENKQLLALAKYLKENHLMSLPIDESTLKGLDYFAVKELVDNTISDLADWIMDDKRQWHVPGNELKRIRDDLLQHAGRLGERIRIGQAFKMAHWEEDPDDEGDNWGLEGSLSLLHRWIGRPGDILLSPPLETVLTLTLPMFLANYFGADHTTTWAILAVINILFWIAHPILVNELSFREMWTHKELWGRAPPIAALALLFVIIVQESNSLPLLNATLLISVLHMEWNLLFPELILNASKRTSSEMDEIVAKQKLVDAKGDFEELLARYFADFHDKKRTEKHIKSAERRNRYFPLAHRIFSTYDLLDKEDANPGAILGRYGVKPAPANGNDFSKLLREVRESADPAQMASRLEGPWLLVSDDKGRVNFPGIRALKDFSDELFLADVKLGEGRIHVDIRHLAGNFSVAAYEVPLLKTPPLKSFFGDEPLKRICEALLMNNEERADRLLDLHKMVLLKAATLSVKRRAHFQPYEETLAEFIKDNKNNRKLTPKQIEDLGSDLSIYMSYILDEFPDLFPDFVYLAGFTNVTADTMKARQQLRHVIDRYLDIEPKLIDRYQINVITHDEFSDPLAFLNEGSRTLWILDNTFDAMRKESEKAIPGDDEDRLTYGIQRFILHELLEEHGAEHDDLVQFGLGPTALVAGQFDRFLRILLNMFEWAAADVRERHAKNYVPRNRRLAMVIHIPAHLEGAYRDEFRLLGKKNKKNKTPILLSPSLLGFYGGFILTAAAFSDNSFGLALLILISASLVAVFPHEAWHYGWAAIAWIWESKIRRGVGPTAWPQMIWPWQDEWKSIGVKLDIRSPLLRIVAISAFLSPLLLIPAFFWLDLSIPVRNDVIMGLLIPQLVSLWPSATWASLRHFSISIRQKQTAETQRRLAQLEEIGRRESDGDLLLLELFALLHRWNQRTPEKRILQENQDKIFAFKDKIRSVKPHQMRSVLFEINLLPEDLKKVFHHAFTLRQRQELWQKADQIDDHTIREATFEALKTHNLDPAPPNFLMWALFETFFYSSLFLVLYGILHFVDISSMLQLPPHLLKWISMAFLLGYTHTDFMKRHAWIYDGKTLEYRRAYGNKDTIPLLIACVLVTAPFLMPFVGFPYGWAFAYSGSLLFHLNYNILARKFGWPLAAGSMIPYKPIYVTSDDVHDFLNTGNQRQVFDLVRQGTRPTPSHLIRGNLNENIAASVLVQLHRSLQYLWANPFLTFELIQILKRLSPKREIEEPAVVLTQESAAVATPEIVELKTEDARDTFTTGIQRRVFDHLVTGGSANPATISERTYLTTDQAAKALNQLAHLWGWGPHVVLTPSLRYAGEKLKAWASHHENNGASKSGLNALLMGLGLILPGFLFNWHWATLLPAALGFWFIFETALIVWATWDNHNGNGRNGLAAPIRVPTALIRTKRQLAASIQVRPVYFYRSFYESYLKKYVDLFKFDQGLIPEFSNAIELKSPTTFLGRFRISGIQYGDIAVNRRAMAQLPPLIQHSFLRHEKLHLWWRIVMTSGADNALTFILEEIFVSLATFLPFPMPPIYDAMIEQARQYLETVANLETTPLKQGPATTKATGIISFFKMENLHPTGSFKPRATAQIFHWFINMTPQERRNIEEIVVESTGNQGLAVVWAVKRLQQMYPEDCKDLKAVVYAGATVDEGKIMALTNAGAEVRRTRREGIIDIPLEDYNAAQRELMSYTERNGDTVLHLQHASWWVLAGYATMAQEIVDQMTQQEIANVPTLIFIPIGSGGLFTGVWYGFQSIAHRNFVRNWWKMFDGTWWQFRVVPVTTTTTRDALLGATGHGIIPARGPLRTGADGLAAREEFLPQWLLDKLMRQGEPMTPLDDAQVTHGTNLTRQETGMATVEGAGGAAAGALWSDFLAYVNDYMSAVMVVTGGNIRMGQAGSAFSPQTGTFDVMAEKLLPALDALIGEEPAISITPSSVHDWVNEAGKLLKQPDLVLGEAESESAKFPITVDKTRGGPRENNEWRTFAEKMGKLDSVLLPEQSKGIDPIQSQYWIDSAITYVFNSGRISSQQRAHILNWLASPIRVLDVARMNQPSPQESEFRASEEQIVSALSHDFEIIMRSPLDRETKVAHILTKIWAVAHAREKPKKVFPINTQVEKALRQEGAAYIQFVLDSTLTPETLVGIETAAAALDPATINTPQEKGIVLTFIDDKAREHFISRLPLSIWKSLDNNPQVIIRVADEADFINGELSLPASLVSAGMRHPNLYLANAAINFDFWANATIVNVIQDVENLTLELPSWLINGLGEGAPALITKRLLIYALLQHWMVPLDSNSDLGSQIQSRQATLTNA